MKEDNTIQLTHEQIDQLFQFVAGKNVPFVDVRHEIVDHLATAIEEAQSQNRELSFGDALDDIYGKFPITGFALLQIEKEKMLKKYWRTRILLYLRSFFVLPRIIMTLFLTLALYPILAFGSNLQFVIVSGILVAASVISERISVRKLKHNIDAYLVIRSYYKSVRFFTGVAFSLPFLVVHQSNFFLKVSMHDYMWFFAFYYALTIIVSYAAIRVFPAMLEHEINAKYQHLKLA